MELISFDDFLKGSASGKYNALPEVQGLALSTYGEKSEPPVMGQASSQVSNWFNEGSLRKDVGETNATKPETKGVNRDVYRGNPSGLFTYGGADHKLIGSKYRVMNPDGTPMTPGASYDWWKNKHDEDRRKREELLKKQKAGMSTGRGSFFDRFER